MKDQIAGQMSIFDFLSTTKENINPWELFAKRGSQVQGGKERIKNFFSKENSKQERTRFLKDEYGVGGFAHPVQSRKNKVFFIHDATWGCLADKGIKIGYFMPNSDEEIEESKSFSELADVIDKLIKEDAY